MDYVENGPLDQLYTFQFSQDHLETYFGTIRRIQGCSDNPTPIQMEGAFRKLLVCNGILTSHYSNVINDETPVLTASSRKKQKISKSAPVDLRAVKSVEIDDFDYHTALEEDLAECDKHVNAVIASKIEIDIVKHIKSCSKQECQNCTNAFLEDFVIADELIDKQQNHGLYISPAQGTYNIVKASNKIISIIDKRAHIHEQLEQSAVNYEMVLKTILNNLDIDAIFDRTHFGEHRWTDAFQMSHKEAFICKIVQFFMKIKSEHVSKQYDEALKKKYIRHKLLKQIHFSGQ